MLEYFLLQFLTIAFEKQYYEIPIIFFKTNYKNELIKVQDNIRYDIINNSSSECENNQNIINRLNNINTAINDFE